MARRRTCWRALTISLRVSAMLLACVSSASSAADKGSGTLEGRIRCGPGRNPWVIVVGKGYGAPVDANGFFRIQSLPAGRHTLLFRGSYCDAVELPVLVRAGATESVEIELRCSKIPCVIPDKADPDCILKDPSWAARAGKPCEVHAGRMRLDVVPIHYGFVGCSHGTNGDGRKFPNARVCQSGGCVIGQERWAEVAFCDKCRAAYYWANPLRLIAPLKPSPSQR